MVNLYLALKSLFVAITLHGRLANADEMQAKQKRVEEVEDEIGYIQSLVLKTPAIASVKSTYQEIEIYESEHFGKVFLLDECLQLTERDAPHYNEMLAHLPMMEYLATSCPSDSCSTTDSTSSFEPMKILVLGGGDGYVVSELLKYPDSYIASIDHVELDKEVINVSKQYFPWASTAWDHKKVNLVVGDGAAFVKEQVKEGNHYHVIIQDASDPFYFDKDGSLVILPSHVLYEDSHFEGMYTLLQPTKGVLMLQGETYNIPSNLKEIKKWRNSLDQIGFKRVRYGSISISSYPTGQIGFFAAHAQDSVQYESDDKEQVSVCEDANVCKDDFAKNSLNKLEWINWSQVWASFHQLSEKTRYYHPRIHRSAFDLPLWVEEFIYEP